MDKSALQQLKKTIQTLTLFRIHHSAQSFYCADLFLIRSRILLKNSFQLHDFCQDLLIAFPFHGFCGSKGLTSGIAFLLITSGIARGNPDLIG